MAPRYAAGIDFDTYQMSEEPLRLNKERFMKTKTIFVLALLAVFVGLTCFSAYGQEEENDIYVIKKGDTLWDLSDEFLKNPYEWPELWQRNQYITNPHLIYPGNLIRLHGKPTPAPAEVLKEEEAVKTVTGAEPVTEAAETAEIKGEVEEASVPPEEAGEVPGAEGKEVVQVLRRGGGVQLLILEEESLGKIIDARFQKRLLCQGDTVYLAMKERAPEVGDRFTVFRTTKVLKNPYTKKTTKKVYVLGALEVTATKGVLYQAEITDSFDAIWRGDEVMTFRTIQ